MKDTLSSLISLFIAVAFWTYVHTLPERVQNIIGIVITSLGATNCFVMMILAHTVIPWLLYLGILCLLGIAGFTKSLIKYNKKEERRKMMDASFSSNSEDKID